MFDDKTPFLISDPCVTCGHTIACHDIYREQPWPCIIAGCQCKEFTNPDRESLVHPSDCADTKGRGQ